MAVKASPRRLLPIVLVASGLVALTAVASHAQAVSQAELLERLRRLEASQSKLQSEQAALREQLKSKDVRIDALQADLERAKGTARAWAEEHSEPPGDGMPPAPEPDKGQGALATTQGQPPSAAKAMLTSVLGTYEQGRGFGFIRTEFGEVNFGIYTYLRYLNQTGLDDRYTNGLGQDARLDHRNDLELNKAKIEFRGWLIDPHFRYVLYTWTNNAAQGQGAQVVLGGNLNWAFSPALTVGAGVLSLPTTRSTQGNFPYWLAVDHRTTADEFFRGSYTMGIFGYGQTGSVGYFAMLGNNLSILGVDAGQLDSDFSTVSLALWWMPTTGEFGPRSGFGDYEQHERVATRIGAHFTFSPEDRQSQPGTEDIDNTQIRLSNGTVIFTPGALAPDVAVERVKYYMTDFDAGVKWRGLALEGEYYLRWLNDFEASGPLPLHRTFDHGFQVLASAMLLPNTAQAYTTGAYIFGGFGDSWEMTAGINYWPFHRRELRLNLEYLYENRSPIGYTAVPQSVGADGSIFNANLELSF